MRKRDNCRHRRLGGKVRLTERRYLPLSPSKYARRCIYIYMCVCVCVCARASHVPVCAETGRNGEKTLLQAAFPPWISW